MAGPFSGVPVGEALASARIALEGDLEEFTQALQSDEKRRALELQATA